MVFVSWKQMLRLRNQAAVDEIQYCDIGRFDEVAYACGREMLGNMDKASNRTNSPTRK